MDILSQYRRTDSTAFAMVGIVLLCVDMCKSDGDFTLNQHEDILELLANSEKDREQIEYLIEKAKKDNQSYKVHAENGKFYNAAQDYKLKRCDAIKVQVYRKIKPGIWVDMSFYSLIDGYIQHDGKRKFLSFY